MKSRDESFQPHAVGQHATEEQWASLVAVGLCPGMVSLKAYDDLVAENMGFLREQICRFTKAVPTIRVAKNYHLALFKNVHPWAGQFRQPGETVSVGGQLGSDPGRIDRELSLWEVQTSELVAKIQTDYDALIATAFQHVRFERIHPFKDGNGRAGRALMHSQLEALFGARDRSPFERRQYIDALKSGSKGYLTDLVSLLAKREGIEWSIDVIISPFRLAPFIHGTSEKSLESDIQDSRRFLPQFDTRQIDKAAFLALIKAGKDFERG